MKRIITLSFLPSFQNIGLLALRLWFGLGLLWIHGSDKLIHMGATIDGFKGMGFPSYLAVCAILAESIGALLIAIGLATRWAALALAINMFVAFSQVHHFALDPKSPPPGSGEMAFLYLGIFGVLVFTGAGRFSVDAQLSKPTAV
jgi:putative oxidoreductase